MTYQDFRFLSHFFFSNQFLEMEQRHLHFLRFPGNSCVLVQIQKVRSSWSIKSIRENTKMNLYYLILQIERQN